MIVTANAEAPEAGMVKGPYTVPTFRAAPWMTACSESTIELADLVGQG